MCNHLGVHSVKIHIEFFTSSNDASEEPLIQICSGMWTTLTKPFSE